MNCGFGAENSNNPGKHHESVTNLLKELTVIPVMTCIDVYVKEKVRLRKTGKPVNDEFDLLIGATAIKHSLMPVTDNLKDFSCGKSVLDNYLYFQANQDMKKKAVGLLCLE